MLSGLVRASIELKILERATKVKAVEQELVLEEEKPQIVITFCIV